MTNCINNIINSQNQSSNNPAALNLFKKEKSRFIEAPQSLPKYSVNAELRKQDEFRKEIKAQMAQQYNKKKPSAKVLFVALTAAIAAAVLNFKKK